MDKRLELWGRLHLHRDDNDDDTTATTKRGAKGPQMDGAAFEELMEARLQARGREMSVLQ